MESNFLHETLKKCVALICQSIGFQGIYAMPLEVLTDLLHRYLRETAVLTHNFAEHDNRTVPTVGDLSYAFLEMKVSLSQLEEFTSSVDSIPFPDPVPKFPLPRTSELNFLKPGSREILSRPLHIHEHLPPMLPDLQEDVKDRSSASPHLEHNGGEGTRDDPLSNGQASPSSLTAFLSSAQRQQRADLPDQVNGLDGEGDPVREIDSVMMTTSGFISSAREGKLPEARLPHIPLPIIPHQAPTSRSSGSSNRNSAPANAYSLAHAAKKKMSLERLMRHKHNMALKKAAQNALNGINNSSNSSTPKNKSAKKSLSHSAVLSMAGAAVDSSFCFTTKHGKSKDKLKPKIPPTPPGTSRFLTPGSQTMVPKPSGVPLLGAVGTPLGPPPKLKIPTPRQKQPEFSTDVLPLPKEDPKEQQERELRLQRKKEKQKELARAARSGMLSAIVGGSAGKDVDDLGSLVESEVRTNKISSSSLLSDALKPKKDKREKEGKKDLKKLSKEGRKDKDKKEKDKSDGKKEKLLKKKEDKDKKDKKDVKKKEKDGLKKLKDASKKDIKKDKDKKSKDGKIKLKDKEKKDKKMKKGSESPVIKSPKAVTVRQETLEVAARDPATPANPRLDRDALTSPTSAADFSPETGKSKLCVFKKSSKSHAKQDIVPDEMAVDKSSLSVTDHSFTTADASADLSGVLSSPSMTASPLDSSIKSGKQKKRKKGHESSESPGSPLTPKIKKTKLSSPRAKSTKNSLDFNVMPEMMDDNASPFSGSGMSGLPSMEAWENRPATPSTPDNTLIGKPPATPGLYPPMNTFSPLSDAHETFAHQEQLETPLTPGQGRTPEHSSRGVTPSSCSNTGTPQSASSSGPSPSPPDGEMSAGPLSPLAPDTTPSGHGLMDNEKKKKEKEHRKEKKEKEKIKKKKDKKLKEKLEKKLKEKQQQKKEKKKKKLLDAAEPYDGPLPPPEVPPPIAPKLVIKRSEPCDASSSMSSFSVSSSLSPDVAAPPQPPPALSRDDQPGSPELAKISALVTRPPKPSGASVKEKSKGSSTHKESREPTPPIHKAKEAKTSKDRDRSTTPPDTSMRMVPPLKIKSTPLDEKPASSKKTTPAASSSHRSGGSSSSKSSSGLTTTTIASEPVLPVVIPPVLPAEPLPAAVVADAVSSIGHFVDDQGNEVWICPTCGKQDDGSPMIGCDTCDDWYHWVCVGIQVPPNESENWYCFRCLAQHKQRNPPDSAKRDKRKHHHHRKKK